MAPFCHLYGGSAEAGLVWGGRVPEGVGTWRASHPHVADTATARRACCPPVRGRRTQQPAGRRRDKVEEIVWSAQEPFWWTSRSASAAAAVSRPARMFTDFRKRRNRSYPRLR